ncbi:MlaD family protein [Streptomyces sp. RB6PN25]|uniref:MlaD family protein n=1 Tax=Streptomyces humicola TaxID=2953240 RepID=A0ABT1PUZ1_9ACTN|nr:MlaD family protein [Streptomyces humicola]MCQ4080815.1 MlaD family protein [Streptomyces humicola]
MSAARSWTRPLRSPAGIGAVLLVLTVVFLLAVYQKERIGTMLSSGHTVKADFSRDYQLRPYKTQVKVAGVVAGTVTGVEKESGHVVVSMKVNDDVVGKLGDQPSALIRPTTLLGGNYYVQLTPGGTDQKYDGSTIPMSRTGIPVELDQVLQALPKSARSGIQGSLSETDQTLKNGAGTSLGNLLADAPGTLTPAAEVLDSLQGTRPSQDLSQLVPALDSIASVMSRQNGQLGDIVDSLGTVSTALSDQRRPVTDTLATLPQTLSDTRTGLTALNGSLQQLTQTATDALPTAQRLGPLLKTTDPVLQQARPLVANLRPLLNKALPVVQQLVPTSKQATSTLDDLKGPVLDRVNGPIAKTVLSPWKGTGYYQGDGGNGHLFYQEVGYLAAHAANLSKYGDKNGRMIGLALGVSPSSAGGNELGTAKLLQQLGLLPQGLSVLPAPDTGGGAWTPDSATAPGQDQVLNGPINSLLGLLTGASGSQGKQG